MRAFYTAPVAVGTVDMPVDMPVDVSVHMATSRIYCAVGVPGRVRVSCWSVVPVPSTVCDYVPWFFPLCSPYRS